jgi:hypothetical protein
VRFPSLSITTQWASFHSLGWMADAKKSGKGLRENMRQTRVEAAHGLVAYLIGADGRSIIQAGNDAVNLDARYRVEFVAEVSLARDEIRGEDFGGISGWEQRIPEGVAFLLEILGTINWWYRAAIGMVMLDCPPDVAMVGIGESARVKVVSGTRNHASPLLVHGVEEGMRLLILIRSSSGCHHGTRGLVRRVRSGTAVSTASEIPCEMAEIAPEGSRLSRSRRRIWSSKRRQSVLRQSWYWMGSAAAGVPTFR